MIVAISASVRACIHAHTFSRSGVVVMVDSVPANEETAAAMYLSRSSDIVAITRWTNSKSPSCKNGRMTVVVAAATRKGYAEIGIVMSDAV